MKLFYRKYGSGPPLIILHGLFGSSDNWLTIAKKLSDHFTVYLPDLRNHGQSPHSQIHDYPSMRDDLHELIIDFSLEKFFLAGHSMGGKTAISFALKWPEMLSGLLIADISPFRGGNYNNPEYKLHYSILQSMLSIDFSKITSRADAEAEMKKSGFPQNINGLLLKNLQRVKGNEFRWKIDAQSLLSNLAEIMKPVEISDGLAPRVTGFPVIFLKGENSNYLPVEDYPDILKIFPAAEFIEIKNSGHWLNSDNPEEVINAINKLIE